MQRNPKENAYERFRRSKTIADSCQVKKTGYFIDNSEVSTTITVDRTSEDINAAMVITNKEGADDLFVFCKSDADFRSTDYFTWHDNYGDEHHFFTLDQAMLVPNLNYRKMRALECNVQVDNTYWAYFKGPLRTTKETTMSSDYIGSKLIPIMVLPSNDNIHQGAIIRIDDQNWKIEEIDRYSIKGICYCTLDRYTNDNSIEDIETENNNVVYVGQVIKLPTVEGDFIIPQEYIGNIKVVERANDHISIKILNADVSELSLIINSEIYLFTVKEGF